LPYLREDELGDRLGRILKDIHIPDTVLAQLQESLLGLRSSQEEMKRAELERFGQRLAQVRRRLDQAYRFVDTR